MWALKIFRAWMVVGIIMALGEIIVSLSMNNWLLAIIGINLMFVIGALVILCVCVYFKNDK